MAVVLKMDADKREFAVPKFKRIGEVRHMSPESNISISDISRNGT